MGADTGVAGVHHVHAEHDVGLFAVRAPSSLAHACEWLTCGMYTCGMYTLPCTPQKQPRQQSAISTQNLSFSTLDYC